MSREVRVYYNKEEKFPKVQRDFMEYLKKYPVFA